MGKQSKILIIDDDRSTLKMLSTILNKQGFLTTTISDSGEAWQCLQKNPDTFDLVLLDRLMPELDGITFLKRMKAELILRGIPIIMLTALSGADDYIEGLQAGAHGYLAKPINPDLLLASINATINHDIERNNLKRGLKSIQTALHLSSGMSFQFRTLEEADALAGLFGNICVDSERMRCGLLELFINAVEHGNLGISYAEKSQLLKENLWRDEVNDRLNQPMIRERVVSVDVKQEPEGFYLLITDEGDGFHFEPFLEFDPERVFDLHGRGIAMAKTIYLDDVQYLGKGNQVQAFIRSAC